MLQRSGGPANPGDGWRRVLERTLERVAASKRDVTGFSARCDPFEGEPLASGTLEREDFHWLGSRIRAQGIPVFRILEGGGGSVDDAFMKGWLWAGEDPLRAGWHADAAFLSADGQSPPVGHPADSLRLGWATQSGGD